MVEFFTITYSLSTQLLSMIFNFFFTNFEKKMCFSNICCSFSSALPLVILCSLSSSSPLTRHGCTLSYLKCPVSIFSATSTAGAVVVHYGKPKSKVIMTTMLCRHSCPTTIVDGALMPSRPSSLARCDVFV